METLPQVHHNGILIILDTITGEWFAEVHGKEARNVDLNVVKVAAEKSPPKEKSNFKPIEIFKINSHYGISGILFGKVTSICAPTRYAQECWTVFNEERSKTSCSCLYLKSEENISTADKIISKSKEIDSIRKEIEALTKSLTPAFVEQRA